MVAEKPSLALSIATFLADRNQVGDCTAEAVNKSSFQANQLDHQHDMATQANLRERIQCCTAISFHLTLLRLQTFQHGFLLLGSAGICLTIMF